MINQYIVIILLMVVIYGHPQYESAKTSHKVLHMVPQTETHSKSR